MLIFQALLCLKDILLYILLELNSLVMHYCYCSVEELFIINYKLILMNY